MTIQVTVGIVTWNSARDLPACLAGLAAQTLVDFELVVVDNASQDDSVAIVRAVFPQARVISNDGNAGFSHAHNQAIASSFHPFYLALNPDVILECDYLSALTAALVADPAAGMAGGKLVWPSGPDGARQIDTTGLFLDRRRRQYLRGHGQLDDGRFGVADEVFGIDGAAPLFRRAMLDDICFEGEYFDESFFAHKEDVDLCWRARWRGWKALYVPRATAIHERSFRPGTRHRVSAETRIHAVKNRYLLLIKNESSVGWRRDGLRILSYDLAILVYMVLLEPRSLLAWPRLMNCLGRARAWRARIQRTRSVDPRSLLVWFELPARSEARPPSSR